MLVHLGKTRILNLVIKCQQKTLILTAVTKTLIKLHITQKDCLVKIREGKKKKRALFFFLV